jgi:putative spermidine/putrescine transport system permease protein
MNAPGLNTPFLAVWTWVVGLCVTLPLVFVCAVSLTPYGYISLPTDGISFRWYAKIAEHPEFIKATLDSFSLALAAAATALVLGTLSAVAIVRYQFMLREAVRLIVASPIFIPVVMSGLAILMASTALGWTNEATRLYVAHAALTIPYVMRTVSASLAGFDPNQELAAQNLGASPMKAFLLVTLPQLGPGVVAGAIFAFIVSFDNVGISIFLTGAKFTTLPVQLLEYANNDADPMTAAVAVGMILISVVAVAVLERAFGLQRLMSGEKAARAAAV